MQEVLMQNMGKNDDPQQKPFTRLLPFIIIGFALMILMPMLSGGFGPRRVEIDYTSFRDLLEQGRIDAVVVTGTRIEGTTTGGGGAQAFVTHYPVFGDDQLMQAMRDRGVDVRVKADTGFSLVGVLVNLLPFLLLFWILYVSFRRIRAQGGQMFSVVDNKARRFEKTKESTTFEDVAGAEGAKKELREIVDFLKHPMKFAHLGAKTPKGALLVGPPGTGKTLLARAVAGEADAPFYSITGSDFMEMFVGVGASRVRSMFRDAKKSAPSIIFIDELDSIGRHRGAGLGGGHDEREQTLNQLLSELDGFEPTTSVVVLAATNRPDILDPALLRPGRFDRRITIDRPTVADREQILKIHSRGKPLAEDVDLAHVARATPGFTGADLEQLLNEAALLTGRKDKKAIGTREIDEARDKVLMGLERTSLVLTDEERRIVAYHEAGHAVLAWELPRTGSLEKVSIIPRDRSLGVTQQLPREERYLFDREWVLDRLTILLSGRAAERLVIGRISSGAENDLKEATSLARRMILDWGMGDGLENVAFGDDNRNVFLGSEIGRMRSYSEQTAARIDADVGRIVTEGYERAVGVLEKRRDALDALATELLDKEEVGGKRLDELLTPPQARA
jgi:cell division protease FtsH